MKNLLPRHKQWLQLTHSVNQSINGVRWIDNLLDVGFFEVRDADREQMIASNDFWSLCTYDKEGEAAIALATPDLESLLAWAKQYDVSCAGGQATDDAGTVVRP